MGFSYITHKGKKVLFVDYTKCKTPEEMIVLLEKAKDEYENSSVKILGLSDFTGTFGTDAFMKRAKKLGPYFDQKTDKSATIGIVGIKKILLQAYNRFIKIKNIPFNTKQEALDYLVK